MDVWRDLKERITHSIQNFDIHFKAILFYFLVPFQITFLCFSVVDFIYFLVKKIKIMLNKNLLIFMPTSNELSQAINFDNVLKLSMIKTTTYLDVPSSCWVTNDPHKSLIAGSRMIQTHLSLLIRALLDVNLVLD